MDPAEYPPKETLPQVGGEDELFNWIYQHVHANFAEHWSQLYDRCPSTSVSVAIMLTYRAFQLALQNQLDESDDDDDDDAEFEIE